MAIAGKKKLSAERTLPELHKTPIEASAKVDEDQYFSRAVGKAFALIEILSRASVPLTLNQVSAEIALTKSSAFRLLYTLQSLKYVTQDVEGRYLIVNENRVSSFAHVAATIVSLAHDPMKSINMSFQETVSLAVLFNNHIEVVEVFDSPRIVRMANMVGRIIPPHASSLGKAITAFQEPAVAKQLLHSYGLPRLTPSTIVDEMVLAEQLSQVRKEGYSCEDEESSLDGCCFGSPIFVNHPVAVAALSVSMPKSRLVKGEERTRLIEALQAATQLISKNLKRTIHHTN
jgi:DNA-binding IclR family transcriptional regulator